MKYITSIILGLLILILVGLVIWTQKRDADLLLNQNTSQPSITNIENKRLIPGNLFPLKEIEIKAPISGTYQSALVKIGTKVSVGDIIAQIKRAPNPTDIEAVRRNLNTAKINFENEEKIYLRNKSLYQEGVIALAEFESAQKNYNLQSAEYNSAQNQLTLLQDGYIKDSDLSNKIKSTTSGTIIDLPLNEGASVIERNNFNEGTTIAVVAQLDTFVFKGKVNETDLAYLKTGMSITLHLNAYKNMQQNAIIEKIGAKGMEEQGVMKYYIEARFRASNDTFLIRSGYTANAELVLQRKENILAIDEKNIFFQNDSTYVELLNSENKFEKRFITTGLSDGIKIEILDGLKISDKIKVIE